MQEAIDRFANIVADPYSRLARWKSRSKKKVIGCFPMYVPEEIIHAAGALPITLLGSHTAVPRGTEHLHVACHLMRGNLGLALEGRLDFLDGVIITDICDLMKWMPDFWNRRSSFPFTHNTLLVGKLDSPRGRRYVMERFAELRRSLEQFLGVEITDQSLRQSIAIYNENRELLNRLYQIRRTNPILFRARDVAAVVMADMFMPKEEHNQLLLQLLEEVDVSDKPSDGGLRLVLSGPLCDEPEWALLDLLEELGMVVADDDLYVGRRYFTTMVKEGIPPLDALTEHYIEDVPCATKFNQGARWADYLVDLTRESEAKGVIISVLKYCEVHSFDYLCLKGKLAEEGIPHLLIEAEPPASIEQLRTRLQAFGELLEGE